MVISKSDRIFVHPDFKKRLKVESALKGLSIIKYTKKLSGSKSLEEEFKNSDLDQGFKHKW